MPFAETPAMEHGLYVLESKTVYRLNAAVLWMSRRVGLRRVRPRQSP